MNRPAERPRPRVHFTAPQHWLNDPNGLIEHDGTFHLFYQHNPLASEWAAPHWGHATSEDLVHWSHQPIALSPGTAFDDHGCYSGCCVIHNGIPTIVYTGVSEHDGVLVEQVCVATSSDNLATWTKLPTPVIVAPPTELGTIGFRDPFVWAEDGQWRMIIGAGSAHGGMILQYRSHDLRNWQYEGVLLHAADDPRLGALGRMWECPQLVQFDGIDALVFSLLDDEPRNVVIVEGRLEADRFVPARVTPLDQGNAFYAPHVFTTTDGTLRMIGWLRETQLEIGPSSAWSGAMSLPRTVHAAHGRLVTSPARERAALRVTCETRTLRAGASELALNRCPFEMRVRAIDSRTAVKVEVVASDARVLFTIEVAADDHRTCVSVSIGSELHETIVESPDERLPPQLTAIVDDSIVEVFAQGAVPVTLRLAEPSTSWVNAVITSTPAIGQQGDVEVELWELA